MFKGSRYLRERLSRFVDRVGHDKDKPTALMTDGAESLLRLKNLLPVPTRVVLDYFWTKRGAHLLLQVRCAVFNGDLLAGFRRWFPAVGTRRIMLLLV